MSEERSTNIPLGPVLIPTGVVLLLFASIGGLTQVMSPAFGLWFVPVILFGGTTWVAFRRQGLNPLEASRAAYGTPTAMLLGFFFGLANFFAVVVPIQLIATSLAPDELKQLYDSTRVFEGQTQFELALIVSAVVLAAPLFEELFFRGFLQQGLKRGGMAQVKAVLLSAAIFSAFHMDPLGFLARLELGVLFGLLVVYTGSLWPAVGAHIANNLISTVIYFGSRGEASTTEAEGSLTQVATLVGIGGLAMLLLFRWAKADPRFRAAASIPEPVEDPGTRRSLYALAAPWIVAGALSIAAVIAIDPVGVQLNLYDARNRLPASGKNAPARLGAAKENLEQLRTRVRRGEATVEEYRREHDELAASLDAGTLGPSDAGIASDAGVELPSLPIPAAQ